MAQDVTKPDAEIAHASRSRRSYKGQLEQTRELARNDLPEEPRQFQRQRQGRKNEADRRISSHHRKDAKLYGKDNEQDGS
ncbi:hypothetical protein ACVWZZ_004386 [Bradyrhizobium sp. LM6.10]